MSSSAIPATAQRYGAFGCSIPVANGAYLVTLKFAELYWAEDGRRRFAIALEGQPVLTGLDVYARVGHRVALDLSFAVNVVDGVLDLALIPEMDNAILCALLVVHSPVPFTDFASWQSFYFGSPTAPGAGATNDPDADGLDNAGEFSFGGDPTVSDSAFLAPKVALVDGDPPKLTISYRKSLAGTNYLGP